MSLNCTSCGKGFDGINPIEFPAPCKCKYCTACCKALINQMTDNKVQYSEFEKSKPIFYLRTCKE